MLEKSSIKILGDGLNIGLSRAYNYQFKEILNKKIDFVFIIDQDSRFKENTIKDLLQYPKE